MSIALSKVLKIIKELSTEISVTREYRPRELRVVWTASSTQKEYYCGMNVVRSLVNSNTHNDPRLYPTLQFIANQISATEAQNMIDRLENLKAFW